MKTIPLESIIIILEIGSLVFSTILSVED